MNYILHAKLPGEVKFIAVDEYGVWGWLSVEGFKRADSDGAGEWLLASAITKYGYRKLPFKIETQNDSEVLLGFSNGFDHYWLDSHDSE